LLNLSSQSGPGHLEHHRCITKKGLQCCLLVMQQRMLREAEVVDSAR
jgi:hypothetical protein